MITVVGGRGFVGGALVRRLAADGQDVRVPARGERLAGDLGTVVYAAGVTADFRSRPLDTVEAHVGSLAALLRRARMHRLVYLSSTRVYRCASLTDEEADLVFRSEDPESLYDATKLAGEQAALTSGVDDVRVARISNVYGPGASSDGFLGGVLAAARAGHVELLTSLDSEKDYISIQDVLSHLAWLTCGGGAHRIYNLAAGYNRSHAEIVASLELLTGCTVGVASGAPAVHLAPIETGRLRAERPDEPRDLLDDLPALISAAG